MCEPMMDRHVLDRLVGASPAIRKLREQIRSLAGLQIPVLIEGPTGSGKELIAQALHALSGRQGRLVALNVCAVPDSMFESVLFGHVRGAFTGAISSSDGYLAEADGGTLFLDEIGGLPLASQAKLLRVLETGEFRPVGASRDRKSDFRVLAATNEPLGELTRTDRFRADLAYRLSGGLIDAPPLRDRRQDIALLSEHFIAQLDTAGSITLSAAALHALECHDWPGNVRELRNTIERAVGLAGGKAIEPVHIGLRDSQARTDGRGTGVHDTARRRLLELLSRYRWNTEGVARDLGTHRSTVYRRMQKLGIQPQHRGAPDM